MQSENSPFSFVIHGCQLVSKSIWLDPNEIESHPLRPFLMRLQWKVDESTDGPEASLRSLLDFFPISFRWFPSAVDSVFRCATSSFVKFLFKDILHNILQYTKFSASSSLRITLLVQKYFFLSVKVHYLWNFEKIRNKKWKQIAWFWVCLGFFASKKVPENIIFKNGSFPSLIRYKDSSENEWKIL